jgi:integrase/recombinase XerD
VEEQGAATIAIDLALQWATQPRDATPWWWRQRLSVVRGFARYRQAVDPATEVPPTGLIHSRVPRATPYLFSDADLLAIMMATGGLNPALRAATYRTLIGLLAVTGMRVGEAIALDDGDVDHAEAVVVIHRGKFGKSRQLFVHPTTVDALAAYRNIRFRCFPRPGTTAFFVSSVGTRLHYANVRAVFRRLTIDAGLGSGMDGARPRLHDLRHSFAVKTIVRWYASELDAGRRLPILSTYLGHAKAADTYGYLSGSAELLDLAAQRLEKRM